MYIGKFRAIVTNIEDPMNMGRIKVSCPKVYGECSSDWCTPCIPFLTEGEGIIRVPKINDTVWIEFEEGDANKPIWVGGWCTPNNMPYLNELPVDGDFILNINNTKISISKDQVTIQRKGKEIILDDSSITIHGNVSIKGSLTLSDTLKCGTINTSNCNLRRD